MNDTLHPDYAMADKFLDTLTDSKKESVTFQFFTDDKSSLPVGKDGKKYDSRAKHRHLNRGAYAYLLKKQKDGCGVWIMVNRGDGKGRKGKNVVKVLAFFIDLDGSPWEPAAMALKPHMRVESSPGRWHLYWLVSDCRLEQFKPIQQAIARKYNGDKSCCDLPRVLRVPGFYHLKKQPVMSILAEVSDLPRYTTQQVIDGLGLELAAMGKQEPSSKPAPTPQQQKTEAPTPFRLAYAYTEPTTGEMVDLTAWAAENPGFDIVKAIKRDYVLGQVVDGKQHIVCPFADEHTDTTTDLATFIANADTDHPSFTIHCMHDHCADRDRLEFLQAMLEKGWLQADMVMPATLELRNPLWVTLQVKEILSSPEWAILSPNERRIAWDLQFFAWQSDDGTIEDNDWKISKFLGLADDEWLKYRKTLNMAGWLIESNGRLTNSLVKREFDLAQLAYSKRCTGGRKGGLTTQEKRRNQAHL